MRQRVYRVLDNVLTAAMLLSLVIGINWLVWAVGTSDWAMGR